MCSHFADFLPKGLLPKTLILCQQEKLESKGVRSAKTPSKHTQQRASLSQGGNARISATLAAAYAEAGRFPNAVTTAERALHPATDQGNTALADAIRA